MFRLPHYCTHLTHASKVMLKILQARLQQYMNYELPDVQAGFRKGRGTRDQIANIHWIVKKTIEFQKNYTKKDLHDPDNHDGVVISPRARHPGMRSQVSLRNAKSSEPSLRTKLVEVKEFQLSYFKS